MDSEGIQFSEIDAFLDAALALPDTERTAYVQRLPSDIRGQVARLLELSEALTLSSLSAEANGALAEAALETADPITGQAGHWRLHRELGAGGMGQVFFATRTAPSHEEDVGSTYVQEAAIKVLWSQSVDPDARSRFYRERRILASLHHPGLARFVDGGFLADGRPWFAMEFVDGVGLLEYASERPIAERLMLFNEVCLAVAYAHERLIVHRDIKPQNVMVDDTGHPRLLDFGIAAVVEEVDDGVRTRTQGAPMTLQYASPEQVFGARVTVASDIYQLGLLLYEMLTLRLPYDLRNTSLQNALLEICERPPVPPKSHNPQIHADLNAIVLSALSKDPQRRYRSAAALMEDIDRYLEGRPVKAMPHSRWYVARRFLRRHALIASVSVASAIALTVAALISQQMAADARAQAQRSAISQQILSDVFQKADPFKGSGAKVTLAEALIKAKPNIAARVAQDPLLAWEVNHMLAQIYESIGLVEHEIEAYQALLVAADQLPANNGYYQLVGVAGTGSALARTNPQDAVAYFRKHMPPPPADQRAVAPWLSAQYAYVGALTRVRASEQADTEAARMAQVVAQHNITDPRTQGRLSQLLAGVARRGGDRAAEDQHWRDTIVHMRQANNPSALAVTLNNRAIHLGLNQRFAESEDAFLEAIGIYESAAHQDPTFATVLRSYAGLQFRTGRHDQAVATTRRALELLDPTTQTYARFVAEVNLADYAFVSGDTEQTLRVLARAIPVARTEFDDDPSIPRRMLRVFAKVLLFGGAIQLAEQALGLSPGCANAEAVYTAVDGMEGAEDQPGREIIWQSLNQLEAHQADGSLTPLLTEAFVSSYMEQTPPFFDVLDHWRVLGRLRAVADLPEISADLATRWQSLVSLRSATQKLINSQHLPALTASAEYFHRHAPNQANCF